MNAICGVLLLLRVLYADLDEGKFSYLLENKNVNPSYCGGGELPVVGEVSFAWQSDLKYSEGDKLWARVWATCTPVVRWAQPTPDYSFAYRAWICDVTRLEVE